MVDADLRRLLLDSTSGRSDFRESSSWRRRSDCPRSDLRREVFDWCSLLTCRPDDDLSDFSDFLAEEKSAFRCGGVHEADSSADSFDRGMFLILDAGSAAVDRGHSSPVVVNEIETLLYNWRRAEAADLFWGN